jgi:hypothetical protein
MFEGEGNYTLSIPAGTTLKIEVPIDLKIGTGFFPSKEESVEFLGQILEITDGFAVLNTEVGELIRTKENEGVSILYKHKKAAENKIIFFSDNNIYQTISIVNIAIHDHSSVIQGGPAFGTYYSDFEEEDNEG